MAASKTAGTEEGKRRAEELVPRFRFERVLNHGESSEMFTHLSDSFTSFSDHCEAFFS